MISAFPTTLKGLKNMQLNWRKLFWKVYFLVQCQLFSFIFLSIPQWIVIWPVMPIFVVCTEASLLPVIHITTCQRECYTLQSFYYITYIFQNSVCLSIYLTNTVKRIEYHSNSQNITLNKMYNAIYAVMSFHCYQNTNGHGFFHNTVWIYGLKYRLHTQTFIFISC